MTDELLMGLMTLIVNICQHDLNQQECITKYENCISLNHHTEAWVTRSWGCFKNPAYPDDSGDKNE